MWLSMIARFPFLSSVMVWVYVRLKKSEHAMN